MRYPSVIGERKPEQYDTFIYIVGGERKLAAVHASSARGLCKVGRGNSGHFNFRSTVTKNGQTLGKLLAMYIQGLNRPTTH